MPYILLVIALGVIAIRTGCLAQAIAATQTEHGLSSKNANDASVLQLNPGPDAANVELVGQTFDARLDEQNTHIPWAAEIFVNNSAQNGQSFDAAKPNESDFIFLTKKFGNVPLNQLAERLSYPNKPKIHSKLRRRHGHRPIILHKNYDRHLRQRIDVHHDVFQNQTFVHKVKNLYRPQTVKHVRVHHHTDVYQNIFPEITNIHVRRVHKTVLPQEITVVAHTQEKPNIRENVRPIVVNQQYLLEKPKPVRWPTQYITQDLGYAKLDSIPRRLIRSTEATRRRRKSPVLSSRKLKSEFDRLQETSLQSALGNSNSKIRLGLAPRQLLILSQRKKQSSF